MTVRRDDGERAERTIDDALAESFPASDAPPWTRGLDPHSVYVEPEQPERRPPDVDSWHRG
jgi:hypothetical protein